MSLNSLFLFLCLFLFFAIQFRVSREFFFEFLDFNSRSLKRPHAQSHEPLHQPVWEVCGIDKY